jgi:CRISPR-associated protein Cas1
VIKRIIDISEQAYVRLKQKQMLIERDGETVGRIPVEDIGIVILQHPAIVITQAVVVACQQQGAVVVFCDGRHLPYSVVLPLSEGHTLHSKLLREQIAISEPTRKRLWQQVVQKKILHQSETLRVLGKNDQPLQRLARLVKSGDSGNHEAQAAQKYWRLLMGERFRRDREADGINALLNYGYAIIRAMVARAIVGGGLHPSLGLHHHNQYNGLSLADDLMEPFRPWVDRIAYRIALEQEQPAVDQSSKEALLGLLSQTVQWEKRRMPLMVACHYLIAKLKKAFSDRRERLCFPSLIEEGP